MRFGVPQSIVTNNGSHFRNHMMIELSAKLGFRHGNSSTYYPQENCQVGVVKKVLKTMLQCIVWEEKTNWHLKLYSTLWAYQKIVKNAIGFTPLCLVYGLEVVLPIECEIPSFKLDI